MKYRIITALRKAVAGWTSLRYVNDDVSRTDVTWPTWDTKVPVITETACYVTSTFDPVTIW